MSTKNSQKFLTILIQAARYFISGVLLLAAVSKAIDSSVAHEFIRELLGLDSTISYTILMVMILIELFLGLSLIFFGKND